MILGDEGMRVREEGEAIKWFNSILLTAFAMQYRLFFKLTQKCNTHIYVQL